MRNLIYEHSEETSVFVKNYEGRLPPNWVIDIMQRYFLGDVVSVGSLVRKMPYLLVDLVSHSLCSWNSTITYEPDKARFTTHFTCPKRHIKLTFLHNFSNGVKYDNTIELLNKSFTHDKWLPVPIKYAKFLLTTKAGSFIFEKSFPANNNFIFSWTCRLSLLSVFTPVYLLVKRFFQKKEDCCEITYCLTLAHTLMSE